MVLADNNIRKRGALKATITRFNKFLATDNIDLIELQARLAQIETKLNEFSFIQTEIEAEVALDKLEEQNLEREEFENAYFSALREGRKKVQELSPELVANVQAQGNRVQESPRVQHIRINDYDDQLPRIPLPTFDGSADKWLNFRDTYLTLIHNKDMRDVKKFSHLKGCLKDDALKVIQHLDITEANYAIAWQRIVERYQDIKGITRAHVKALFEMPTITKGSADSLNKIMDDTASHLNALKSLEEPTDQWDTLIIHLVSTKFDFYTRQEWEKTAAKVEKPTFNNLKEFIRERCQVLNAVSSTKSQNNSNSRDSHSSNYKGRSKAPQNVSQTHVALNQEICKLCNEETSHPIFRCPTFIDMSVPARKDAVLARALCLNCLRSGHSKKDCKASKCKKCDECHNTMLHTQKKNNDKNKNSNENTQVVAHSTNAVPDNVMLSTVVVFIFDKNGKKHKCRALLDSGSQSNMITEELCSRLKLSKVQINMQIKGINAVATNQVGQVKVAIQSRINNSKYDINCLILNQITENLPLSSINKNKIYIPENIKLADPGFNEPGPIDMLIGNGLFWDLIKEGDPMKIKATSLCLRETQFGWIVAGSVNETSKQNTSSFICINQQLYNQMEKFWKIETCNQNVKRRSPEEVACEKHFEKTVTQVNGRFKVSLPLKEQPQVLGESRGTALKRVISLERRLKKDAALKKACDTFLEDYLNQNHMSLVSESLLENIKLMIYYVPYHIVLNPSSLTTKIRVVFDGSATTSSGISINDIQMTGPTLQEDLFIILNRFRLHSYVVSADIKQMYRQILVNEEDSYLQCILWKPPGENNIQTYKLNTVTYGYKASSYLAIKCLQRAGDLIQDQCPSVARAIKEDFYVDNLLTGANSIDELKQIKQTLDKHLEKCHLPLRQWASNCPSILEDVNENITSMLISDDKGLKTLGLLWNPVHDDLKFISHSLEKTAYTRRTILSAISQIFDPLGFINPVTVCAKLIMQELWTDLDWDDAIPKDLEDKWIEYRQQMKDLDKITIKRHVLQPQAELIEMHVFCDASEKAYGACVYLTSAKNGNRVTNLLCAKSRVAPLKKRSVAKLELCAALLGAQLAKKLKEKLTCKIDAIYCWSDSTITLAWIKSSPHKWKTFVATRTAEIQESCADASWRHVPTQENPADILSRGSTLLELKNSSLWWSGPTWLASSQDQWPADPKSSLQTYQDIPEAKTICHLVINIQIPFSIVQSIFEKFSDLQKIQKTIAWCLRYVENLKNSKSKYVGKALLIKEMSKSMTLLVKYVQITTFKEEIYRLSNNMPLHSKSKLLDLNVFLDSENLIRVGGRLTNAKIDYGAKHQLVLPHNHRLTELIIEAEHVRLLHAGGLSVLNSIRQKYWPVAGRSAVRQVIRKCITCFRANPVGTLTNKMGDLPEERVTQASPFYSTGVDFAGPFLVKEGTLRGRKTVKTYICVFVCMATKAVHLELASDLSAAAFLNCLRRFVSRRGRCAKIFSDNGTNFVGAANELKDIICKINENPQIQSFLLEENISWHFIPPKAPHFGGLRESAVKSAKVHMKRIFAEAHMTYEEFYTLLAQIESCLNSRPLSPMSEDPADLSVLTPGHFLIGRPFVALPERNVADIKDNQLNRFKGFKKCSNTFGEGGI